MEFSQNYLWESTGIYGQSTFRKTDPETGQVLDLLRLPDSVFAEGFTFLNDSTVCLLTWREHIAYTLNPWTMEILDQFYLDSEGWGICNTGEFLVQSDGTSTLRIRNANTFDILDSLTVTLNGQPQFFLNELEFFNGYVLANQWRSSRVFFINTSDGTVERIINLRSILPGEGGVANGIASAGSNLLYCTGKNWPYTVLLHD